MPRQGPGESRLKRVADAGALVLEAAAVSWREPIETRDSERLLEPAEAAAGSWREPIETAELFNIQSLK